VTPRTASLSLAGALIVCACLGIAAQTPAPAAAPAPTPGPVDPRLAQYKRDVVAEVEALKDQSQQMVDMVFSFGELGFQEYETTKYLTGILEKNGFRIERGVAGIPTAWTATR
jgi:aminobenzoyl-glutamate utilization protein B